MDRNDLGLVLGIAEGGSRPGGEEVFFGLVVDGRDGPLWMRCQYETLARLITLLRSFGQIAAIERHGRLHAPRIEDAVHAFTSADRPTLSREPGSGDLTIHFATREGVPIAVALPPDQARVLAERLLVAATGGPPPVPAR